MDTSDSGVDIGGQSTVGTSYSTAPAAPTPAPDEPVGKGTWYEGIDKTIFEDPSLKAFKDETGKLNGQNLLKSYVHAQKAMGRDRLMVPTDNDAPEAWKEVYHKLGLPKDIKEYSPVPTDYEVENQEVFNQFKEIAFNAGILPKQAQQILEWHAKNEEAQQIQAQEAQNNYYKEGIQSLQKEFGQAFDQKIGVAQQAVKTFCSPEIVEMLDSSGLGNDPAVVKFFVSLGEQLLEDGANPSTGVTSMQGKLSPQEAQEEINKVMSDMSHPYFNKDNAQHNDAVRKMNQLFEMLG